MSFRKERLEAAKKDSFLLGLAVGARSPSQVPKAVEDLRAIGIEFTSEAEKIAKVVAQLKKSDQEKFKAIFGEVLERQKNKEFKVSKKDRKEVIKRIRDQIKEHNIKPDELSFKESAEEKVERLKTERRAMLDTAIGMIINRLMKVLEENLCSTVDYEVRDLPITSDMIKTLMEELRRLGFIVEVDRDYYDKLCLRVRLKQEAEEPKLDEQSSYGKRMKSLIEKAKAKKTEKPDKIDSKIEKFIDGIFDGFERQIEQGPDNPNLFHVVVDSWSRGDFETLMAKLWEIGFIVVCTKEEGRYRYIKIQLPRRSQ